MSTPPFDFANILFAGPCNARCPTCIGKQIDTRLSPNNLDVYPPLNLECFIAMIQEYNIRQVGFTGATTDPQLYRHEARLLAYLRQRLPPGTSFSLHTNGRLALRKIAVFNQYDRACLSFPSFDPYIYLQMMGVTPPPDLAEILHRSRIPLKLSCLVDEHTAPGISSFLYTAQATGIRRVVLRKLYGDRCLWSDWIDVHALQLDYRRDYCGNPVYDYKGMEVTLWDFELTESRSINLFSSGEISLSYHLVEALPTNCDAARRREGNPGRIGNNISPGGCP